MLGVVGSDEMAFAALVEAILCAGTLAVTAAFVVAASPDRCSVSIELVSEKATDLALDSLVGSGVDRGKKGPEVLESYAVETGIVESIAGVVDG